MKRPPTPKDVEAEYAKARIKGRTPSDWLGKLKRLHADGKLPADWTYNTGLEAGASEVSKNLRRAFETSAGEERKLGAAKGREAMSRLPAAEFTHRRQKALDRGEQRRKARDQFAADIVDAFCAANSLPSKLKHPALAVARWWVAEREPGRSVRSLAKSLRAARKVGDKLVT